MEFVPCGDLSHMLHRDDPLPWTLRLRISLDIAKGMNHLQSVDPPVIHRDLRSPNIFIVSVLEEAPVNAKVADFGLSRLVAPSMGGALATWQWLAPEVLDPDSKHYDERSDMYSFGIVLWEIASRGYPFDECYQMDRFLKFETNEKGEVTKRWLRDKNVVEAIIKEHFRPTIPPSTPAEFSTIMESCWLGDPAKRPSFLTVVKQLRRILEGDEV